MDCIDCHNRPTHIYDPPTVSVDLALAAGEIDSALPFVKRTGVRLLAAAYPSKDSARAAIETGLTTFYQDSFPEIATAQADAISHAVATLREIYSLNFFPSMKVSWRVYPANDQHRFSKGCFRCHDGNHKSSDGTVVTHECTTCHAFLVEGRAGEEVYASTPEGLPFQHPVDIGNLWEQMTCDACHSGAGME